MADRKGSASLRGSQAASGDGQPPAPGTATSNLRSTSPYGTRSRNRGARVNYAEDKDNEMDYEYTSPPTTSTTTTTTTTTTAATPTPTPTITTTTVSTVAPAKANGAPEGDSSRRPSATASAKGSKESTPRESSTSLVAPATAPTAGKKRKGTQPTVIPPLPKDYSLSNMLVFSEPYLQDGKLAADDGTVLQVHDHIYLICEPPGEPYYLARIMEFLHAGNDPKRPIDAVRVNWYYRPKDIQRKVTDTRVLFASMHSDCCPLNSIRGKCYIAHRSEIDNLDEYRKQRDHFYFERMFDRYIHRYYDVIPTHKVRNVPEHIRKVIVERWKYLLVEPHRGKELCSQMKECRRCKGYCANNDSVHCAVCNCTYHMNCVRPPLLKKPSRGFAWACGPCNRAQERKLEARNGTPSTASGTQANGETEEEHLDDEEEEASCGPPGTETPSESALDITKLQEPTPEQRKLASMWPMRYLGQHCKIEDALDYDDRIYPRASSRLGPKHQAIVPPWPGRPFELVKPAEGRKKYSKGPGGRTKLVEAAPAKNKRPPWVVDEPAGYIERGKDDGTTATLLFKLPVEGLDEKAERQREEHIEVLDRYMEQTEKIAEGIKMKPNATNFLDKAAELLYANDWNDKKALEQLAKVQPVRDLKEPRLKPDEVKRFEEGVAKYGSELHLVCKHVKTRKEADIVRFYYQWKKTDKGREIWGNFEGRKSKKEAKKKDAEGIPTHTGPKLVDDVADDDDDSAFDVEKATSKKRGFHCKFCHTKHSRQWRRAPGVAPGTLIPADKGNSKKKQTEEKFLVSALCRRCAELWRRYAIVWEDPDEIQKKVNQGGGRAWKRRIDEEMLRELYCAQQDAKAEAQSQSSSATPQPSSRMATPDDKKEPPRKKAKTEANGVKKSKASATATDKQAESVKEAPPPPPPEPPKPKMVFCGVCNITEELGRHHASCRECKMTVHKRCYGVEEVRIANKWLCDMCANDKNPTVSTNYECVLCPHPPSEADAEPEKNNPYHKPSYKKKKAVPGSPARKESPDVDGRKVKDLDKFRPERPRDPLKKTANNNWAHVVCAVWTPEIKFSDPNSLKVIEGIGTIPQARWIQECKICKLGSGTNGACVQCANTNCHTSVHIWCASRAGWKLGFDIQPVKGSRRDTVSIVRFGGETGNMIAGVWCPEHGKAPGIHSMTEVSEETGQTALELYVRTYKQADLTLTGTVRKASLVSLSTKATHAARRNSLIGSSSREGADATATVYIKTEGSNPDRVGGVAGLLIDHVGGDGPKQCLECKVDSSPLWWKVPIPSGPVMTNGSTEPEPRINGYSTQNRMIGLLCNRCHCKSAGQSRSTPPIINQERRNSNKFTPLPPLQLFLAQQHAPPPQAAPTLPPAGTLPPLSVPMAPPLGAPVPPVVSQPGVPPMSAPMPHKIPSLTAPPMMAHGPPHMHSVHQSPTRSILQHPVAPPQPQHIPPLPQLSPTARGFHHAAPPHGIPPPPPHQHHAPPPVQTHLPHHIGPMSPHKPPHHASPPKMFPHPPPHIPMHTSTVPPPPLMMNRRSSRTTSTTLPPPTSHGSAPTAPMSVSQIAPQHPPALPPLQHQLPRPEEPKRVMSAASGSPALANLLS